MPLVWDPAEQVRMLKENLNDPNHAMNLFVPGMIPNCRAVIQAYESNSMPTEGIVYFKHGKMVSKEEASIRDALVWEEVRSFHQRSNCSSY